MPFTILKQTAEVASTWRRHYDRLHLHTIKQYSALPRMRWADHVPLYPSRADAVDYLDAYARRFRIELAFGQRVEKLRSQPTPLLRNGSLPGGRQSSRRSGAPWTR